MISNINDLLKCLNDLESQAASLTEDDKEIIIKLSEVGEKYIEILAYHLNRLDLYKQIQPPH